jgi:hypothetical protein
LQQKTDAILLVDVSSRGVFRLNHGRAGEVAGGEMAPVHGAQRRHL